MSAQGGLVVIGIGNALCGDDGAGAAVLRALRVAGPPTGVRLVDSDGDPAALLEAWQDADVAFVVDAVASGAAPGTLFRNTGDGPGPVAASGHRSSHALGLADAIGLAHSLGHLPGRLMLYGIEGLRFSAGVRLSPEVDRTAQRVAGEILALLRYLTGSSSLDVGPIDPGS